MAVAGGVQLAQLALCHSLILYFDGINGEKDFRTSTGEAPRNGGVGERRSTIYRVSLLHTPAE